MVVKDGPHDPLEGLTVRLIFAGLLTVVRRVTAVTAGAHLKLSPILPELPAPALPENVIETGLVDQRAFGALFDANPTAE